MFNYDEEEPKKKQAYRMVYAIVDREGSERKFWLRVGAAFENRDGSVTLKLDALPRTGTLQIRDAKPFARPEHTPSFQEGRAA